MGNTRIQDSATGNIMGLSPGFIPVGMKEHGGIMYIASVNKDGEGEIGTIPSPIIRDVYKEKTTLNIGQTIPINQENPLLISNKLYPADKFIVNLRMSIDKGDIKGANVLYKQSGLSPKNTNDPSDFILYRRVIDSSSTSGYTDIYTPLISYSPDFTDTTIYLQEKNYPVDLFSTKGVYKMSLLSSNTNGQKVEESLLNCQVYGDDGERSKYWFIHSNSFQDIFPKDLLTATLNSDLKQFPSSNKPGKLAVKLETEDVGQFGILPRKDGLAVPITFKDYTDSVNYITYFPGFYYSTDSGLYIDTLSNIKIIDESTNENIFSNTDDVTFKNYKAEGLSSTSETKNDESIDVWTCAQLPQTKTSDEKSTNTFILSNIKSITNHNETSLRSSTKGVDESPHTGVIQVNLGNKYNNWYRLELDYWDQYDTKQGMFTKRFNPYINDVFGTNLHSVKPILGNPLKMGTTSSEIGAYNDFTQSYTYLYKRKIADSGISSFEAGKGYMSMSEDNIFNIEKEYVTYMDVEFPDITKTAVDELGKQYSYIYNLKPEHKLTYNQTVNGGTVSGVTSLSFSNAQLIADKPFKNNSVGKSDKISSQLSLQMGPKEDIIWTDDSAGVNSYPYLTANSYTFKSDTLEYLKDSMLYVTIPDSLEDTTRITITPKTRELSVSLSELKVNDDEEQNVTKFQYNWTAQAPSGSSYNMKINITTGLTARAITSLSGVPIYSIIPYITLQGINDKNEIVGTYRLSTEQSENVLYECNFESKDNQPRNLFKYFEYIDKSDEFVLTSYNFSYTEENDISGYNTYIENYQIFLEQGIYVLNIIPHPNYDTCTLGVQIANTQEQLGEFTNDLLINADYGESMTVPEDEDGYKEDLSFYSPIVLIIDADQEVTFNISDYEYPEYPEFWCQDIGLFKLKNDNIDINEIIQAFEQKAILYKEYMKKIINLCKDKSEKDQYNFIQNYGVFFREGYVFVDGILNDEGVLEPINIRDTSYSLRPFIPSDPSILPIHLSSNWEYTWNVYVMPKSILNGEYPNFVFSNPLDEEYTTEPGEGNLRRFVEQQN